ncbi:hydroxymethylbilane synthase [Bacillaceae bacterium Marseille-Q3522]|nr:hydroxymethylbilane synthase [Bacillaceae bacterium Marseille-Q3522]
MRKVVVGSRRSKLAITQTNWVIEQLIKLDSQYEFEVKEIVTKGDQILDVALSKVGGKGLFVKEIEQAILNGEIDMAVHSMKDMPAVLPEGLIIGAIPQREDHRDVFISKNGIPFSQLKPGAIVGTSSLRRAAQLLAVRPDIKVKQIRGNIDTRLAKLKTESYDGIILAAAGLARMGWTNEIVTQFFEAEFCLPAVGQGALAIECRENDTDLRSILDRLTSENTSLAVRAERAFLQKIGGSCQVPVGGFATVTEDKKVILTALVATTDGKMIYKEQDSGYHPEDLGISVARKLIDKGAKALIKQAAEEQDRS